MLAVCFLCCVAWTSAAHAAGPRVVHVVVALCDNRYQGIVPVPAAIGNGQDPAKNLYWGAAYGVKTYFTRQPEWSLVLQQKNPACHVLERLVFKLRHKEVYLVADAWDGEYIKDATKSFLEYAAGAEPVAVALPGQDAKTTPLTLQAGGDAQLSIYIGHDGLMDFSLWFTPKSASSKKREVAVFACKSKKYFGEHLEKAGATPLVLTTSLMCPEAYTTNALVLGWAEGENAAALKERVAAAYNRYQKCGLKAARGVFTQ